MAALVHDHEIETKTALMCAQEGDFKTLQHIIEHSGDINECDSKGLSPLHHAAYFDEGECAELIISCLNCDIKARTNRGCTALHIACASGSSRVLSKLLQCDGSLLDIQNDYGETGLHLACSAGNMSTIILLLEAGASPNITDQWNRTPMQVSFEQGNICILALFEDRGFEYRPSTSAMNVSEESKLAHHDIIAEFMSKLKTSETYTEVEVKGIFKDVKPTVTLPTASSTTLSQSALSQSSGPSTSGLTSSTNRKALSKMVEFPGSPTEVATLLEDLDIDPAGKVYTVDHIYTLRVCVLN